jgi:hypothetical protein
VGEPIHILIENRHDFVNLNRYSCTWILQQESGVIRADVPARTQAVLTIVPKHKPSVDDVLVLEFRDEIGRLVDGYRLPFRPPTIPELPHSGKAARMVNEGMRYLSLANVLRLVGTSVELAFDSDTGECLGGLAAGELVLVSGPALHVMRNDAPLQDHPTGWQCRRVEHGVEDGWAVVRFEGQYGSDFAGVFEIKMDDSGIATVSYRFTYAGTGMASRELGLRFTLPLYCDRLTWNRRAEWSYYPSDHIGRPAGTARGHPAVSQVIPPRERPWGLDDHPWGSNDFRSTKRHIYRASLTCPTGPGVEIVSDGTQHVRATLGVHEVTLTALDFYGGTATGYAEWDNVYGEGRRLRPGEEINGRLVLRLLTASHSPDIR